MIVYHARAQGIVDGRRTYAALETPVRKAPKPGESRSLKLMERAAQRAAGRRWLEKYPHGRLTSTIGMYIDLSKED